MKARALDRRGRVTTWALIFDKDDEVMSELTRFAETERLSAAHFTAIGAFKDATLGYFDPERKDYTKIPVHEQVEVVSMVGDVAVDGGEPKVHAHVVVSKSDGRAYGGHLLEARVWPTLELILSESPRHLRRRTDRETGLALIDLDACLTSVPTPGGRSGCPRLRRRRGGSVERMAAVLVALERDGLGRR
jgi:hypothetical protein